MRDAIDVWAERNRVRVSVSVVRVLREGRNFWSAGDFNEMVVALTALEGEGIPYHLKRYKDASGRWYYDVRAAEESA